MPHELNLITTISMALGMALLCGFAASRLKLPPVVGYLLAGVLIGPYTPGVVADMEIAAQLAEIGVMLLMFGVGLHFSLNDLLSVRKIAIPGALVQIFAATAMGAATALYWGWEPGAALVFGISLSVASTVVLLRALEARGVLESINGHIAVGWLIVEDLVMVLVLVLLPVLAGIMAASETGDAQGRDVMQLIGITLLKLTGFVVFMLIIGRRVFPKFLWLIARSGSRELFTLCVLAAGVGVAYASARMFDVSFALGAFFAGMMLRESEFSHRAAQESLPLRDAFSVLFFVSVGMLFNPAILVEEPMKVLVVVGIIMLGKTIAAVLLVLTFRYPLNTALTVGASLAQIGEFSFILAGMGVALELLPMDGQNLILAGALITIALNAAFFAAIDPVQDYLRQHSAMARKLEGKDDPLAQLPWTTEEKYLSGQVVLVGYGRVGRRIAAALIEHDVPFVVIEQNREVVQQLRENGVQAVSGNATEPVVLVQAHIARAEMLIIATPESFSVRQIVTIARTLNPAIEVVVRTHSDEEAELLEREGIGKIFMGEQELAAGMTKHVLARRGFFK